MSERPGRLQVGIDLALFAATVALAALQRWSTTDLVWSLWIASLTVGYSLIVSSILGTLMHAPAATAGAAAARLGGVPLAGAAALPFNLMILIATLVIFGFGRTALAVVVLIVASTGLALGGALRSRPGWGFLPDAERGLARAIVMLPAAAFMLGFFTVHFGMFHFIHGLFLNGFFPLVAKSPFGTTPDETFGIIAGCAGEALARYWPFVGASALSRLSSYAQAWTTADGSMMMRPYLNVIRMHVMIFVFAFLSGSGLQAYALYPLLAMYFLPVGPLFSLLRARRAATGPR